MAITPEQAATRNDQNSNQRLKEAEEQLDDLLKSGYRTGTSITISKLPLKDDHWLQKKLLDLYRRSGWEIETGYDQRDNDSWTTFTARKSLPVEHVPGSPNNICDMH